MISGAANGSDAATAAAAFNVQVQLMAATTTMMAGDEPVTRGGPGPLNHQGGRLNHQGGLSDHQNAVM